MALTFQRRETTVHDQLQITELALGEHDGGEGLGLGGELLLARSIAGEQVLQDTTVGSVGHCVCRGAIGGEGIEKRVPRSKYMGRRREERRKRREQSTSS